MPKKIVIADELSGGRDLRDGVKLDKIASDFSHSFKIIDVVVYVVNRDGRGARLRRGVHVFQHEHLRARAGALATIKVLGFRRREVYRYINKETVVLTLIGIVAGWPLGSGDHVLPHLCPAHAVAGFFDTIVEPGTDVFASADVARLHAHHQQVCTNCSLDKIDTAGLSKSAE